jgi:hypothetical protein
VIHFVLPAVKKVHCGYPHPQKGYKVTQFLKAPKAMKKADWFIGGKP